MNKSTLIQREQDREFFKYKGKYCKSCGPGDPSGYAKIERWLLKLFRNRIRKVFSSIVETAYLRGVIGPGQREELWAIFLRRFYPEQTGQHYQVIARENDPKSQAKV